MFVFFAFSFGHIINMLLTEQEVCMGESWPRSPVQTERSEVCTSDWGQDSPIQTDLAKQSLLFSTVACNAAPTRLAEEEEEASFYYYYYYYYLFLFIAERSRVTVCRFILSSSPGHRWARFACRYFSRLTPCLFPLLRSLVPGYLLSDCGKWYVCHRVDWVRIYYWTLENGILADETEWLEAPNNRMFQNESDENQIVFFMLYKNGWLIWSCPKNYSISVRMS